jgi:hypothetical protein
VRFVGVEDISIVYLQQQPLPDLNQAVSAKSILGKAPSPDTASFLALALVSFTLSIRVNYFELYKVTIDSLHAQGAEEGGLGHNFGLWYPIFSFRLQKSEEVG